jgi:CheY-like chemotaxis protein
MENESGTPPSSLLPGIQTLPKGFRHMVERRRLKFDSIKVSQALVLLASSDLRAINHESQRYDLAAKRYPRESSGGSSQLAILNLAKWSTTCWTFDGHSHTGVDPAPLYSAVLTTNAMERPPTMKRLLVIDDDEAIRKLVRMRLADTYNVIDTGDPEQALELALADQPDAILLDVQMPRLSGFDLCHSLKSLTYTANIPIFIISGGVDRSEKYRERMAWLGAKAYIDKPIDFPALRAKLEQEFETNQPERRQDVRLKMRVGLRLKGVSADGEPYDELARTINVSPNGFLCSCARPLIKGMCFEVFLLGDTEVYAGRARVVRREPGSAPWQDYGFQFEEKTSRWLIQQNRC